MKLCCPYCTREIPAGSGQCSSCGTVYDLDTVNVLKLLAEEAPEEYPDERRTQVRTAKVDKVALSTPHSLPGLHLETPENISLGGLFIKTDTPLKKGERFHLRLCLPDQTHDVEILCEVTWSQREGDPAASGGTGPSGMGVRFVTSTQEDVNKIVRILSRSLDSRNTFL
jgi:uncharacterized protein (TIGR02266 family)